MREVIVETIGKGTRTIQVGIDWNKIEVRKVRKTEGILCSPQTFSRTRSDKKPTDTKSWKTPKKGESKPKRSWQRNGFGPRCRRKKYGKRRGYSWPSVRTLNEMGLCIYPYVSVEDMEYWENLSEDHLKWCMGED